MADVFISYASEDRERAAQLAGALEAKGWSVWWDRGIIPGETFADAIERELEAAKSVVVLWSKDSVSSEWVNNEAALAKERGILVPATIQSIKVPLAFRHIQTADLSDWRGEFSHAGFQALCKGVATKIGDATLKRNMPSGQERQSENRSLAPEKPMEGQRHPEMAQPTTGRTLYDFLAELLTRHRLFVGIVSAVAVLSVGAVIYQTPPGEVVTVAGFELFGKAPPPVSANSNGARKDAKKDTQAEPGRLTFEEWWNKR